MCKELCDQETGECQSCQDCGRLICWDHDAEDDVCARPGVTEEGDLYCSRCASRYDRMEQDEEDF